MTLYLTRAVLDREARAAALATLLDPPDPDRALDAHHRLIWTLFPGRNAVRDYSPIRSRPNGSPRKEFGEDSCWNGCESKTTPFASSPDQGKAASRSACST